MGRDRVSPLSRALWAIVFLLFLYRLVRFSAPVAHDHATGLEQAHSGAHDPAYVQTKLNRYCWRKLSDALSSARPTLTTLGAFQRPAVASFDQGKHYEWPVDVIHADANDLAALTKSHARFESIIEASQLSLAYKPHAQGIVVPADSRSLASVVIMLRLLRRTGSVLPVEVMLPDENAYDETICKQHLPLLQARCMLLSNHMASAPMPKLPETNQRRSIDTSEAHYKLLAVAFSTFEDVLMLDPYTLVFNSPDSLFRSEPYLSHGLVLWPDFWLSTQSPVLRDVQRGRRRDGPDSDIDDRYGFLMQSHDMRTVDFGQMMASKSQHMRSLLLAIYYTTYGEGLYESLLSQASIGEHGSGAIKAAAQHLDAPVYFVRRPVESVGFPDEDKPNNDFRGIAMLQSSPLDDFHRYNQDWHLPLFVRAVPRTVQPGWVMKEGVTRYATSNKAHRMWAWFRGRDAQNGWKTKDPEQALWEEIEHVGCILQPHFRAWEGDREEACAAIKAHRLAMGFTQAQ